MAGMIDVEKVSPGSVAQMGNQGDSDEGSSGGSRRHRMNEPKEVSPGQRRYAMVVLFIVGVLNLFDRQLVMVLQEPIKAELNLSDLQLGLLTGMAFALVYSFMALPIASIADRTVRKYVLGISLLVWGSMTALSGLASSFISLAALRMGVAVGEAGSVPATHSMIADYYPPDRRPLAYSIWTLSTTTGMLLGYFATGWLLMHFSWRGTLIFAGIVSLLFAPFLFAMREPGRGTYDQIIPAAGKQSMTRAIGTILKMPVMQCVYLAVALQSFSMNAIHSWSAPFYARAFGLSIEHVSFTLTLIIGGASGLGVLISGALLQWLGKRDIRWYMWLPAIVGILLIPLLIIQFLAEQVEISLIFGFLAMTGITMSGPCAIVTIQRTVPSNVRATAAAIFAFVLSAVGLAFGPPMVGLVSDVLIAGGMAKDSLRYAILCSVITMPIAVYLYYRASVWLGRGEGEATR